jgi:hypothetical protein
MSKRTKLTVAITLVLLAVVAAAVFFVGPVKGALLSLIYSSKVTNNYKSDFASVNERLSRDYGIIFSKENVQKKCGPTSGYYSGGVYIFGCRTAVRAQVAASEEFVNKWQATSTALEEYLLADGWAKGWNARQPIDEILDNFQNDATVGVNYFKRHGKVTCTLSLKWLMPETPNRLTVDEECSAHQRTWGP